MNKLFGLSDYQKQFVYRVEEGDNLNLLADKFHTTSACIISLNSLTEEVNFGELILIERTDGEEYIVKVGDDLDKISGYNEEKRREIIAKNKTDVIFVGQKIYI